MDSNHQRIMIMRLVFFTTISILLTFGYMISEFIPTSSHIIGFVVLFVITWSVIVVFVIYEKMR